MFNRLNLLEGYAAWIAVRVFTDMACRLQARDVFPCVPSMKKSVEAEFENVTSYWVWPGDVFRILHRPFIYDATTANPLAYNFLQPLPPRPRRTLCVLLRDQPWKMQLPHSSPHIHASAVHERSCDPGLSEESEAGVLRLTES
jgi:hypothetical protein